MNLQKNAAIKSLLVLAFACHPSPPKDNAPTPPPALRELSRGAVQTLEPGVLFREDVLSRDNAPVRIWLYTPSEKPPTEGRGLILIAPAGGNFLTGMLLAEGDRPEHLPYVRAGFVVVSYDIAGGLPNDPSEDEFQKAVRAFYRSRLGVVSASEALDYALREEPDINPARIFAAGHSSAATLALQTGALDPRVDGVIAYAPVTNLLTRLEGSLPYFEKDFPEGLKVLQQTSPHALVAQMNAPILLFHSTLDSTVSFEESRSLAAALKAQGKSVSHQETQAGGHYDSMLNEGIAVGLSWLNKR